MNRIEVAEALGLLRRGAATILGPGLAGIECDVGEISLTGVDPPDHGWLNEHHRLGVAVDESVVDDSNVGNSRAKRSTSAKR